MSLISCLILYEPAILSLTKCRMLRAMFYEENYEIHVLGGHTVQMFLWNVAQRKLWQAAVIIEEENISVGYAYGSNKTETARKAEKKLKDRLLQTELE